MAIAISVRKTLAFKWFSPIRPARLVITWVLRLWWHTKAYATIFGVMALTLLSLFVLFLHAYSIKAFKVIQKPPIKHPFLD